MTHQQETRYRCDRCGFELSVPLNSQPAMERGKPPPDWRTVWVGEAQNSGPPLHLCPSCAPELDKLMSAAGR